MSTRTLTEPMSGAPARASAPRVAIAATALTKRYGRTVAVSELELSIPAGEVYGFLGPNGAGKTTTIRMLLGLHRPTAGSARVFGGDCWRDAADVHRQLAYVAGEPSLWPQLTCAETFEFLARVRGGTDTGYRDLLIERFQLDPDRKVRALSKGNRQKVQLIAALATRAPLLILDEPTAGLDPLMEVAFRESIHEARENRQTVFLSSHILSEVEALCDRVGILREGRLIDEGTLQQLRHLAAQTIEITFEGPAPTIAELSGVRQEPVDAHTLRFEVSGPVAPLIAELGGQPIAKLLSREPSLEEVFLHHYRSVSGDGQL